MIRYLSKTNRLLTSKHAQKRASQETNGEASASTVLGKDLAQNIGDLQDILGHSGDIVVRRFQFGHGEGLKAAVLFVDGLVDKKTISEDIIKPLMYETLLFDQRDQANMMDMDRIQSTLLAVGDVKQDKDISAILTGLLSGNTLLLIDGFGECLLIDNKGWQNRGVQEPKVEQVVRGPREGFTETIRFNTALLRRKIQNPHLTVEHMTCGTQTATNIALIYLNGIVNPKLVKEIKERIDRIDTDAILESGYIEQFIEDAPFSPFSTIGNSEKPDVVAARILEGRVAILVDGTPIVLTAPMLFLEGFHSSEDHYSRPYYSSFIRLLRFFAFFVSLLAPATYVAITTYHQELLPTQLLITMAAASVGTPFPSVLEALGMGVIFEILREGGIRLPSPVGQALSIVGALIIGDAAVQAGLIGAPMIIVVGFTAVASFLTVTHTDATTVLRFILIVVAGILGAFGIICVLLAILIHLCSLRSFGTPYLSPLAPLTPRDLDDAIIRAPIWLKMFRPRGLSTENPQRQAYGLKPKPPEN